jgi:hypothetical protein
MPVFVPAKATGGRGGHFVPSRASSAGGGHFVASTPAAKEKHRHGGVRGAIEAVGGLQANLGRDVIQSLEGIPAGVVSLRHPVRAAEQIGRSYEQTYGPLAHGDVNAFLHELYAHPLGPILDVLTVATAGAGGVAKAGGALSKAGVISDTGRLARLGRRGTIALRNEPALVKAGKLKGFEGAAESQVSRTLKTRRTSANPVIRARQVALDKLLKQLPSHTWGLGEIARHNRELDRLVRHGPLQLAQKVHDYRRAYSHLSKWEHVVFHLRAVALHPEEYAAHLEREFAGRALPPQVAKTLVLLRDPKLLRAFEQPSPRLTVALAEGRKLSEQMKADHLERGTWSPAFEDRPYLHNRLVSGARHNTETGDLEGGLSVPELQAQIGGKGLEQPFYMPDLPAARKLRDTLQRSGGGKGIPKPEAALHRNAGIMFNTARLAMHPDALDRGFMAHTRFVLHNAIHDALVQNAVRVPVGHGLPKGWTYVRERATDRVPPTERIQGDVLKRLDELVPDSNEAYQRLMTSDPAQAAGEGSYRLAVREATVRQLAGEFKRSEHFFNMVFRYPTQAWRALVLGARVGFFTNNVVGNHFLYALRFAGIDGLRAYLRTLREVRGPAVVHRLLRTEAKGKPEFQALYEEFAPELAQGTFGATQFEGLGRKLSQGLGPLTAAVSENLPRRAAFRASITPAVRAAMKADGRRFLDRLAPDTRTFNEYARKALEQDPWVAREAIDKVNDALGNYLNLSEFERRTVRGLIPFYSWLRAISTITGKTALNTPGRALVLTRLGQVGAEYVQSHVGPIPDFLLNIVPFGARHGGEQGVITTTGLNPFATIPQVMAGVGGLLAGRPGETGKAASALGLNPFIGGAVENLTGKRLFTGKDVKGPPLGLPGAIAANVGVSVPPAQLIQALRGHGRTSKLYGQQTAREALLAYLGVPVKQLDVARAQSYAGR